MSGLGKTRMLEEGGKILRDVMKLDAELVASVIVPYTNEYRPQPVEQLLPITASFSWRMLYRFFLAGNSSLSFEEWFKSSLPANACHLTFGSAVQAIECKLRQTSQRSEAPLYFFLGIDDYEVIEQVGARQKHPDISLLQELVRAVRAFLYTRLPRMIVLPMLAGRGWEVMVRYPWYYPILLLPMPILTMNQIFKLVGSKSRYAALLENRQICRDLVILGGVPRWAVDYLAQLEKACEQNEIVPTMDMVAKCFSTIRTKYIERYVSSSTLDIQTRIRLAAYAVSGPPVWPNDTFDGKTKWPELMNSSLCLVVNSERCYAGFDVHVPYALLRGLALSHVDMKTDANLTIEEETFVKSLNDLHEYVDKTMFDRPVWESSAMFSACFYAVRINALLVLGRAEIGLDLLFRGARMDLGTKLISVKLAPSRVFPCAEKFDASTPATISRQENSNETIDWASRGCIAVNIGGGAGTDIFFALEKATRPGDLILPGNLIVFVDQRKRRFRELQPSNPDEYLNEMSACPSFLQERKARSEGFVVPMS